jgi:hypothetical protein
LLLIRLGRLLPFGRGGVASAPAATSASAARSPRRICCSRRRCLGRELLGRMILALLLLLLRRSSAGVRSCGTLPASGTLSGRSPGGLLLRLWLALSGTLPRNRSRAGPFSLSRAKCRHRCIAAPLLFVVPAIRAAPPSFGIALAATGTRDPLGERHKTGELYTSRPVALTPVGTTARLDV